MVENLFWPPPAIMLGLGSCTTYVYLTVVYQLASRRQHCQLSPLPVPKPQWQELELALQICVSEQSIFSQTFQFFLKSIFSFFYSEKKPYFYGDHLSWTYVRLVPFQALEEEICDVQNCLASQILHFYLLLICLQSCWCLLFYAYDFNLLLSYPLRPHQVPALDQWSDVLSDMLQVEQWFHPRRQHWSFEVEAYHLEIDKLCFLVMKHLISVMETQVSQFWYCSRYLVEFVSTNILIGAQLMMSLTSLKLGVFSFGFARSMLAWCMISYQGSGCQDVQIRKVLQSCLFGVVVRLFIKIFLVWDQNYLIKFIKLLTLASPIY